MGCFFVCFRIKDDDHRPQPHLVSNSLHSKSIEPVESRRCLSSLLLSEDNGVVKESRVLEPPRRDVDDTDLKEEAKFLKACGTLLETPTEIRKASVKVKDISPNDGDHGLSEFHSWLPTTSIRKLNLPEEPDQPATPTKLCEQWVKEPLSSDHTPSSFTYNEQGSTGGTDSFKGGSEVGSVSMATKAHSNETCNTATSSASPRAMASNVLFKNKTVHFECDADVNSSLRSASSTISSQNSKQSDSAGEISVSKHSPYPTPLKLSDEMQTPGTVFPAYLENMTNGKNIRIRSQYVYSVMNPVDSYSQWKEMKEETVEQADNATLDSEVEIGETSAKKDMKVEASLSSWLKPVKDNENGSSQEFGSITKASNHFGRTPGDRPILGMVAAHWNEDEPTRISPKWWDGNGIPNSTNKYKEDQKVSWHATPFEERLEKALSEDSFVSQRRHNNGTPPLDFDENEEADTALSQQQSSICSKSVVSF